MTAESNTTNPAGATLKPEARISHLPYHSGDGYGYGGGAILTIGRLAFMIGENRDSQRIAERIARLWNANLDTPDPGADAEEVPF